MALFARSTHQSKSRIARRGGAGRLQDMRGDGAASTNFTEASMNVQQMLKLGVSVVAIAACFGAQAASNGVTATITPEKSTLGSSDDVVVNVTITNTSSKPQYILKYHLPSADITEPLFDVTRDGVKVAYLGKHFKRRNPRPGEYDMLPPGASLSQRVELSALYDFSVTGDYAVRYHTASLNLFNEAGGSGGRVALDAEVAPASEIGEIDSDAANLWVDGVLPRGAEPQASRLLESMREQLAGSLSFANCSASRQSQITSALTSAKSMAASGSSYLNAGTVGTRYTKWFGANNASRYTSVKSHFTAIKDAFANKPLVVDCGCTDSAYAYVYPSQPYKIYVCNAFWPAPISGTDSKGGTLVHEMSHFTVVAGTDDWAYGQSAAASLATSNPSKAIDNADSHEYFGENTPSLP
jgi:peptidyl-Lys metalloendopeptidase